MLRPFHPLIALAIGCAVSAASIAQDGAFIPRPARVGPGIAPGTATLFPDSVEVATVGSYELTFTVGGGGIVVDGSILVDFPKAWFSNPVPLIKPVQTDDPAGPHYVGVDCSRAGVTLDLSVDHFNFDGNIERYRHVMRVVVRDEALHAGDVVTVIFGNTTSPIVAGSDAVRVAVNVDGSKVYRIAGENAQYTIEPGPATQAMLIAPTDVVVGETVEIQLTLFDRFNNIATGSVESFALSGLEGAPDRVEVTKGSGGRTRFRWTPEAEGFVWPVASGKWVVRGGPIRVHASPPVERIYWGDLHSHTRDSKDGIGHGEYAFARDATRLDFYASTEHSGDDGYVEKTGVRDGISKVEWSGNIERIKRYYEPDRFVTLLAYESSMGGGHHNVFFRGLEGLPWPEHRTQIVERLWELLHAGEAITIPHHLGIQWGRNNASVSGPGLQPVRTGTQFVGGPRLDWTRPHDSTLRPLLEMYSVHGQSEYYDPGDPLAYEAVKYTAGRSSGGPYYAKDAWAAGQAMGVIASSDDHESHPGMGHHGLAAVFAGELSREGVFDALAARKSYGTTGARIILDFEMGGASMGRETAMEGDRSGRVLVAAPQSIRYAEVLAFDEGGDDWRVAARWDDPGLLLESTFEDNTRGSRTTYYLRAELKDAVGPRTARAWSSPIWVSAK